MLILMPVLLLFIFGYAENFSVDKVSVIIIGKTRINTLKSWKNTMLTRTG